MAECAAGQAAGNARQPRQQACGGRGQIGRGMPFARDRRQERQEAAQPHRQGHRQHRQHAVPGRCKGRQNAAQPLEYGPQGLARRGARGPHRQHRQAADQEPGRHRRCGRGHADMRGEPQAEPTAHPHSGQIAGLAPAGDGPALLDPGGNADRSGLRHHRAVGEDADGERQHADQRPPGGLQRHQREPAGTQSGADRAQHIPAPGIEAEIEQRSSQHAPRLRQEAKCYDARHRGDRETVIGQHVAERHGHQPLRSAVERREEEIELRRDRPRTARQKHRILPRRHRCPRLSLPRRDGGRDSHTGATHNFDGLDGVGKETPADTLPGGRP